MSDAELINAAIEVSGISGRLFAERVLSRDERTVRRWRSGGIEIPALPRMWLARWLTLSERDRAAVVKILIERDE